MNVIQNPLRTVGALFSIAALCVALYAAFVFYREWRKTDATKKWFERAVEAAKASHTILWNQFVIVIAGVVAQLDSITEFLNMPQATQFINQWFTPRTVAAIMLGIALVSIKARLSPASRDPVT